MRRTVVNGGAVWGRTGEGVHPCRAGQQPTDGRSLRGQIACPESGIATTHQLRQIDSRKPHSEVVRSVREDPQRVPD